MAVVFLSCGQREGEREIAKQIQHLIESEFEMKCYNADSVQGFDAVMSILDHLSKADYYLFIDFKREGKLPISVFTHQEFALARAWGISELIAFQEEGLESYGILGYVLAHPIQFTRQNLLDLVRQEIRLHWTKTFSRNLVCARLDPPKSLIDYGDHTGRSLEMVWSLCIQNRREDRTAFNTVAILHSVTNDSTKETTRPDSAYLKWAGQMGYQKTIFPDDEATFDAFAIRVREGGVFLHSAADVRRQAIITDFGRFSLEFRVFSEGFPPLVVRVKLTYPVPISLDQRVQMSGTFAEIVNEF